jgi:hypothetical protein
MAPGQQAAKHFQRHLLPCRHLLKLDTTTPRKFALFIAGIQG